MRGFTDMWNWRQIGARAIDAVLPPRCLNCDEIVEKNGSLCSTCWEAVDFISQPFCVRCGIPFEFEADLGTVCGACSAKPPDFDQARSVMRYGDRSRGLILRFKHADRTEGAVAFANWMARAGGELLSNCDLIVPVPLHWARLFKRRYNQAALLANILGQSSGRRVAPRLLQRVKATPSQGRLSRTSRERNVASAFRVHPSATEELRGRRVLLVDDVFTTGATVSACSRALKRAGADGVDVLVLARVSRPSSVA